MRGIGSDNCRVDYGTIGITRRSHLKYIYEVLVWGDGLSDDHSRNLWACQVVTRPMEHDSVRKQKSRKLRARGCISTAQRLRQSTRRSRGLLLWDIVAGRLYLRSAATYRLSRRKLAADPRQSGSALPTLSTVTNNLCSRAL